MASITSLQKSAIQALITKMISDALANFNGGSGGGGGNLPTPLSISTSSIDPVVVGSTYNMQFAGSGPGTLTWTMTPAIPGVTLSSAGVLSGTPTAAGNYPITVTLSSNSGATTSRQYTVVVNPAPVVTQWVTYASDSGSGANATDITGRQTDNAFGGTVKTYQSTAAAVYGIVDNDIVSTGSGTGSVLIPSTSDTVEVEVIIKALPNTVTATQLISIELSRSTELITNASLYRMRMYNSGDLVITKLTNGTESTDALGASDTRSFKIGDKVAFRRTMNAGKTVAYLSVRVNDIEVASWTDNTPLAAGSYVSWSSAARSVAYTQWIIRTMNAPTQAANAPKINAMSLSMTEGAPVDYQFTASGDPTITFTAPAADNSNKGLPPGLSLSTSGRLTGIPSVPGNNWVMVIRATNSVGNDNLAFTFNIAAAGGSGGGGGGAVGVYGSNATYWPGSTPRLTDSFDKTYTVAPTWGAVRTAILDALSTTGASAKVQIEVTPGQFPSGLGAGSSDTGVLQNIGSLDRTWNIVVKPRDGIGSVTVGSGGSAFVDVKGVSIVGIDFTDTVILMRNSSRLYVSHTFARKGNITSNAGTGSNDCEYVECVFGPAIFNDDEDRCASRVAGGFSAVRTGWRGCYLAPMYKTNGTTGHCDTIQLSSSGMSPNIGTKIIGCVLFGSSNQGFAATETPHAQQLVVENSLFIAGMSRQGYRYPQTEGMYQSTDSLAFVGGAVDIIMRNSIVAGKVGGNHKFSLVENTRISFATSSPVTTGSFTVDSALATISPAEIDALAPYPTISRQRALWEAQFKKVVA